MAMSGAPASALTQDPTAAPDDDPAQMFDRAERLYRDGRYLDAIAVLLALQREHADPILDYNLGRAYESAGQIDAAIDAYGRYLETAPDAVDRDDVEARVARLRVTVAPPIAVQPPRELPPPTPAPPRPSVAPWVIAGLGGAGLGVAAGLGGVARSRRNDAVREPIQAEAADRLDEARRFALAANIGFAVAGAVATAGVAWGIASIVRRRQRLASVGAVVRPRHAEVGSPKVVSSIE